MGPTNDHPTLIDGKYELGRALGQGGIGTVYESRHTITQKPVAVKLISGRMIEKSQTARARFLREAQAASSIDHHGVPTIFDAGINHDGSLYLVMELLSGEDLATKFTRGKVSVRNLVSWMIQVLDILSYAHDEGFIHRDIKPGNIFVDDCAIGNAVKLLDFGTIKSTARKSWQGLTQEGALIGTPAYMSPEQVLAQGVSRQSDIWGVGAVMFHGLVGYPPIPGTDTMEILTNLAHQRLAPLPADHDIPEPVCQVMKRALNLVPEQRWASAKEMQSALAGYLHPPQATLKLSPERASTVLASSQPSSMEEKSSTLTMLGYYSIIKPWIRGRRWGLWGLIAAIIFLSGASLMLIYTDYRDARKLEPVIRIVPQEASKGLSSSDPPAQTEPSKLLDAPATAATVSSPLVESPSSIVPPSERKASSFASSTKKTDDTAEPKENRPRQQRQRVRRSKKQPQKPIPDERSSLPLIKDYQ